MKQVRFLDVYENLFILVTSLPNMWPNIPYDPDHPPYYLRNRHVVTTRAETVQNETLVTGHAHVNLPRPTERPNKINNSNSWRSVAWQSLITGRVNAPLCQAIQSAHYAPLYLGSWRFEGGPPLLFNLFLFTPLIIPTESRMRGSAHARAGFDAVRLPARTCVDTS